MLSSITAAKVESDLNWTRSCSALLVASKAVLYSCRAARINSDDMRVFDMLASPMALIAACSAGLGSVPKRCGIYGNMPHFRVVPA